jgi:lysozyme family protein
MTIIKHLLANEGGVKDVGDGKGITRWGQTPDWLKAWHLPIPKSAANAEANYWEWLQLTGLSHLVQVDDLLALAVVDWAVNSGHRTAIKSLQRHLKVSMDGSYGPQTRRAVDKITNRTKVAREVIADRAEFFGKITKNKPSNVEYIHGWLRRLAKQIRVIGD